MDAGWFDGLDPDDADAGAAAIRDGSTQSPADWPTIAINTGFADTKNEYYTQLHQAAVTAAARDAAASERTPDQQLAHAVRALDDVTRVTNELVERATEWAGSYFTESATDIDYIREVADRSPRDETAEQIISLANLTAQLESRRAALQEYINHETPRIAPNLSALAGASLAARLIALAGGLDELAKKPSGTVQVLGAENALFAHLHDRGSSPKHGVIYTHDYVRGTPPSVRGSAARALAGKLTIAARVDYYSGERKPELDAELDARIERLRKSVGDAQ